MPLLHIAHAMESHNEQHVCLTEDTVSTHGEKRGKRSENKKKTPYAIHWNKMLRKKNIFDKEGAYIDLTAD